MKKFTSKVQRLSQRAAEIRQAIESVPPQIAEVREAVAGATAHVQKLRADIISSVATLRAETDAQLIATLREIDGSPELLAEAGCRLEGVDMDLGPTRRLVVQLERVEDVGAARVRALINTNSHRPVVVALLAAVIKADELAEKVELTQMSVRRLTVDVGLIPSVKIGWRTDQSEEEARQDVAPATCELTISPMTAANASMPTASREADGPALRDAQGTAFFERREVASASAAAADTVNAVHMVSAMDARHAASPFSTLSAAPSVVPGAPAAHAFAVASGQPSSSPRLQGDWRKGALDRFKKMPDLAPRG